MLEFDHAELTNELGELDEPCRVLFATLVAERLFPLASDFFENTDPELVKELRVWLDKLWQYCVGETIDDNQRELGLSKVMLSIEVAAGISGGEGVYPLTGLQRKKAGELGVRALRVRDIVSESSITNAAFFAENAITALAYALRSISSSDSREPAWAAQTAYDVVDRFAMVEESGSVIEWTESELLARPIVQRELAQQIEDIITLKASCAVRRYEESWLMLLRRESRQQGRAMLKELRENKG